MAPSVRSLTHSSSMTESDMLTPPQTISSKRASVRYSTYSASPSFDTISTDTSESGIREIKQLSNGLERLENKTLAEQRFVPSEQKKDVMSKISLGAKVERALGRRMTNQDYVRKEKSEKSKLSEKI